MTSSKFLLSLSSLVAVILIFSTSQLTAATIWNESLNGDLSNIQGSPTTLTLASGANAVIGTVGTGDTQDWLTLNVPVGFQLTSIVLASYSSTDAQGFTGVQAGSVFIGSSNSAGSYLGYAHFGTGATNPSTPTNLVGSDILPIMASTTSAPGSQGFIPPLGSGNYSFLIQQLGATTSYEFDYTITAIVPEPETLPLLCVVGGMGFLLFLRRRCA